MEKNKSFKIRYIKLNKITWLVLLVLSILAISLNIIWLVIDEQTPHWDAARHLWTTLVYKNIISNFLEATTFENLKDILISYWYYPPLFYLPSSLSYFLFGIFEDLPLIVQQLFLPILICSVYGIGKEIFNRKVGILGAITVICIPIIVTQFREFQPDAVLVAMVALSVYLLLKTKHFESLKFSVFFAVSFALGMLIKWTFIIFLSPPWFSSSYIKYTCLFLREPNVIKNYLVF